MSDVIDEVTPVEASEVHEGATTTSAYTHDATSTSTLDNDNALIASLQLESIEGRLEATFGSSAVNEIQQDLVSRVVQEANGNADYRLGVGDAAAKADDIIKDSLNARAERFSNTHGVIKPETENASLLKDNLNLKAEYLRLLADQVGRPNVTEVKAEYVVSPVTSANNTEFNHYIYQSDAHSVNGEWAGVVEETKPDVLFPDTGNQETLNQTKLANETAPIDTKEVTETSPKADDASKSLTEEQARQTAEQQANEVANNPNKTSNEVGPKAADVTANKQNVIERTLELRQGAINYTAKEITNSVYDKKSGGELNGLASAISRVSGEKFPDLVKEATKDLQESIKTQYQDRLDGITAEAQTRLAREIETTPDLINKPDTLERVASKIANEVRKETLDSIKNDVTNELKESLEKTLQEKLTDFKAPIPQGLYPEKPGKQDYLANFLNDKTLNMIAEHARYSMTHGSQTIEEIQQSVPVKVVDGEIKPADRQDVLDFFAAKVDQRMEQIIAAKDFHKLGNQESFIRSIVGSTFADTREQLLEPNHGAIRNSINEQLHPKDGNPTQLSKVAGENKTLNDQLKAAIRESRAANIMSKEQASELSAQWVNTRDTFSTENIYNTITAVQEQLAPGWKDGTNAKPEDVTVKEVTTATIEQVRDNLGQSFVSSNQHAIGSLAIINAHFAKSELHDKIDELNALNKAVNGDDASQLFDANAIRQEVDLAFVSVDYPGTSLDADKLLEMVNVTITSKAEEHLANLVEQQKLNEAQRDDNSTANTSADTHANVNDTPFEFTDALDGFLRQPFSHEELNQEIAEMVNHSVMTAEQAQQFDSQITAKLESLMKDKINELPDNTFDGLDDAGQDLVEAKFTELKDAWINDAYIVIGEHVAELDRNAQARASHQEEF